jgi:hypothetical protein
MAPTVSTPSRRSTRPLLRANPTSASEDALRGRRRDFTPIDTDPPSWAPRSNHAEPRGLVARLRERKLVEWMLAYLALAWMALQMTDALREIWSWPVGLQRGITLALGLGALPAVVVAWYHGEKGRQEVCLMETGLLGVLSAGAVWVIWRLCT